MSALELFFYGLGNFQDCLSSLLISPKTNNTSSFRLHPLSALPDILKACVQELDWIIFVEMNAESLIGIAVNLLIYYDRVVMNVPNFRTTFTDESIESISMDFHIQLRRVYSVS